MFNEEQVKALHTHLCMIASKIPKEMYIKKLDISAGEYMKLLIQAQLSVIDEILETIDKDREEAEKHKILLEFEKFRGGK